MSDENKAINDRIERIRQLSQDRNRPADLYEAASLAQSVLHDTVGGSHPLMANIKSALEAADWVRAGAASRGVVELYD
jgi:hypothetical protein